MAVHFDLKIYRTTNPDGTPINPKPKWWQRGPFAPSKQELPVLYLYSGDVRTTVAVNLETPIYIEAGKSRYDQYQALMGFTFVPTLRGVDDNDRR